MVKASILGTATVLSGEQRSTEVVGAEAMPQRAPEVLKRLTGIDTRYWVDAETKATDLATEALNAALSQAGLPASALKRIIFVSSTGGDWLVPANVNAIIEALELDDECDGFDLNNACTGFLTALDLAASYVATRDAAVGVVVVETLSRFCRPQNPRPYMVFGDAAMAAVVGPGAGQVLGSHFANAGSHRHNVHMHHPERLGELSYLEFNRSRHELLDLATDALGGSAQRVLDAAGLTLGDIEHVVPHQPNGAMLRAIASRLGLRADQLVPIVAEVGSVGAASVAVGLDRLIRARSPKPGERILMMTVGAGMSYGALRYEVG